MTEPSTPSTPLSIGCDITPGPDGSPWIRVQVATIAVGAIFAFPLDHAEQIITGLTKGIQQAAEAAEAEQSGAKSLDVFQTVPEPLNRAARRHPSRG